MSRRARHAALPTRGARFGRNAVLALLMVAAAGILYDAFRSATPDAGPDLGTLPEREAVLFRGGVLAGGDGVPGAIVTLFEAREGFGKGFVSKPVTAGATGQFEVAWKPTTTARVRDLRLAIEAQGFPRTLAPVDADGSFIELSPPADFSGRVLSIEEDAPLVGATLLVAPQDDFRPALEALTDQEGRFRVRGLARGEPLDVLVLSPGRLRRVHRLYRAGDEAVLRLERGTDVLLLLRGVSGEPAAGVSVHLPMPRSLLLGRELVESGADGRVLLRDASDGGEVRVRIADRAVSRAGDGAPWLAMDYWAIPVFQSEVVLWAARPVELQVRDRRTGHGVRMREIGRDDVSLEVSDSTQWWGVESERVAPLHRWRPGSREGTYLVDLPRCDVSLSVGASGYGDESVAVKPNVGVRRFYLVALSHRKTSTISLRAIAEDGAPTEPLRVAVLDRIGGYFTTVSLGAAPVELEVPAQATLQVASIAAAGGYWIPTQPVKAPPPGGRGERTVRLKKAVRVTLHVKAWRGGGPVDGTVFLRDVEQERIDDGREMALENGRVRFWVRPGRQTAVRIRGGEEYYERNFKLKPVKEETEITIQLGTAARLRVLVQDEQGAPVPFAVVRLWPPDESGQARLWKDPRAARTDAAGRIRFYELRGGDGAMEVSAHGFGMRRFAIVNLPEASLREFPPVRLKRARLLRGRVVGPTGAPLARARVRVVGERIAPLPSPVGDLDLYDPEVMEGPVTTTDAEGRFEIRNEVAGDPLLAIDPDGRPELAPAVVAVPVEGKDIRLTGRARIEYHDSKRIFGIFQLLDGNKAVWLQREPGLRLRPLSTPVAAGKARLHIRGRDQKTATVEIDVAPGQVAVLTDLNWR